MRGIILMMSMTGLVAAKAAPMWCTVNDQLPCFDGWVCKPLADAAPDNIYGTCAISNSSVPTVCAKDQEVVCGGVKDWRCHVPIEGMAGFCVYKFKVGRSYSTAFQRCGGTYPQFEAPCKDSDAVCTYPTNGVERYGGVCLRKRVNGIKMPEREPEVKPKIIEPEPEPEPEPQPEPVKSKTVKPKTSTVKSSEPVKSAAPTMKCGGATQNAPKCPEGYKCQLDRVGIPGSRGTCVLDKSGTGAKSRPIRGSSNCRKENADSY
ncbi:hypothetical protein TWF481_010440 [Arthrobotrys musiformis]|uniref:Uncharacterized protein n=1 Tax=Arthrobotrys musiformis TaxID=47236 RepID=A0AAV9W6Q9_9PEZI